MIPCNRPVFVVKLGETATNISEFTPGEVGRVRVGSFRGPKVPKNEE